MRFSPSILYISLFLNACVTPFEINTPFQEQLVVEGMITDQSGPYLIKISKTVPISQQVYKSDFVKGAQVVIKDDQGNSESLTEKSSGNYFTQSFQGMVGRVYSITITTTEGQIYQSIPEKLLPVGDFSNLHYEFVQKEPSNVNRQVTSSNGFNIYIDSDVLPEQEGRAWWRLTGTFEIFTYPRLQVDPEAIGTEIVYLPDPPACSGYRVIRGVLTLNPNSTCTCCTCWVTHYNESPLISDPNFISNQKINNLNIAFIEANVRNFYNKYYLEVEQLSISQALYDFWKIIKVQKQNTSNLFQTPSPKTSGNIIAITPNSTSVIGYFAASASKKHAIVLNRSDVPYEIQPIDTLAMSCIKAYKFSSATKPPFW